MSNEVSIEKFVKEVNLLAILDHSGRGGNVFVLSIFDQHPEVLCCGWLHYAYSYMVEKFGDAKELDARKAHKDWTTRSYYRFIYQDMNDDIARRLMRFGSDISVDLDRNVLRKTFDDFCRSRSNLSRRDLLLASYYSYAKASGRDISKVKYVIVDDAVSLRGENLYLGFSGKVIDAMVEDFTDPKFVSLVRDPRAAFASTTHQFINEYGNMYGYRADTFLPKLKNLYKNHLNQEDCTNLFVWFYHAAAARIIWRLKEKYQAFFYTLKNEDLNLNFIPTIESFCQWLEVETIPEWKNDPYEPTIMGKPWGGTGAYNNNYYVKETYGPLENDPNKVSKKVTGPNAYVTKRWRKKLLESEIMLCEIFFKDELEDLNYEFLFEKAEAKFSRYFIFTLIRPFRGELPKIGWILQGRHLGVCELLNRLFYSVTFLPFYCLARITLFRMAVKQKFFGLDK